MPGPKYCRVEDGCGLREKITQMFGDADPFCKKYGLKGSGVCLAGCDYLSACAVAEMVGNVANDCNDVLSKVLSSRHP